MANKARKTAKKTAPKAKKATVRKQAAKKAKKRVAPPKNTSEIPGYLKAVGYKGRKA